MARLANATGNDLGMGRDCVHLDGKHDRDHFNQELVYRKDLLNPMSDVLYTLSSAHQAAMSVADLKVASIEAGGEHDHHNSP